MGKVLSQTCVKINNSFFDVEEGSVTVKKGYGTKEIVATIGQNARIVKNVIRNISERFCTGSFNILNTQENQDKIDALMDDEHLTIELLDPNGNYKPITNAMITNDPEWKSGSDGITIEFAGDAMEE